MKFEDLTGQKFGRLTVLDRAENKNKRTYWRCLCDCGNIQDVSALNLKSGHTQSCGCFHSEKIRKHTKPLDLIGKKYGKLTVIDFAYNKNHANYWKCKCECGNTTIVSTGNINKKNGGTKSCGCEKGYKPNDLTGQRFSKLLVTHMSGYYIRPNGDKLTKWRCKCDCGNECDVIGSNLLNGDTKSCGCMHSKGESFILRFLNNGGISFQQEYSFIKSEISNLRYDFAIFDDSSNVIGLIEYDGIQHFEPTKFHKCSHEKMIEDFSSLKTRDIKKTIFAFEKNIPLLRIHYLENDIDILLQTFINKINCVPSA